MSHDGTVAAKSADLMPDSPRFDVSVILPFGDDEEALGIAVKRTAEYLRNLGVSFELLAVDEDSGDNSHAVLALLRAEVPEIRVTHASGRGRGVDVGAARAQGTLLLVTTPDVAAASLDGVGEAIRRLLANQGDGEVSLGRYTIAHRVRALVAFRGARLLGAAMHRRLQKRLAVRHLTIRVSGPNGTVARSAVGRLRAFARR
jgi:glycosyltransferase involved in cell wall biosynthesis